MPRKTAGARLYERSSGIYAIRDAARFINTGTRNRREAEAALARYIAERDRPTGGPATPDQMTVARALEIYGEKHAPTVRAPERIGYAIQALLPILGDLPVGSINSSVCRRYAETRDKAAGTVRKELGVLQAAINFAYAEGYLTGTRKVRLPKEARAARPLADAGRGGAPAIGPRIEVRRGSTSPGSSSWRSTPARGLTPSCGLQLHAQHRWRLGRYR